MTPLPFDVAASGPRAWVDTFLARFDALDRLLQSAGFPGSSPWWRAEIDRFFRSGRRRWVIRAGRRAGKSSTLCRVAVCWALWGPWSVPAGDTAIITFLSIDRDEASARLRTIREILGVLGVVADARSDEIELPARRVVFKVATSSIRGTVGYTSVCVVGDEMARWESRDTAANPAAEVMGSVRPTMATVPEAFEVCSSSPWSTDDYHAELFDAGDTEHQVCSFAPTWRANPSISESRTHELEPDERIWSREYAAEPGSTVSAALDAADIARAVGRSPRGALGAGFISTDASSLRGDAFTFIAGRVSASREIVVREVAGWESDALRTVSMSDIVARITQRARIWGTSTVFGDQREEAGLTSLFREHGITFRSFAWTEQSKDTAVMALRRMLREDKLHLPDHAVLTRQLTQMRAHLMPSGRTRYATNGQDYASALITLLHASVAGGLAFVPPSTWRPDIVAGPSFDDTSIGLGGVEPTQPSKVAALNVADFGRRNGWFR